ncbi:MAG TPA: hypothetical protein VEC57_06645 [Candidatus Limnocylindrales bacterium]|nr:hypothetical protein [Candidatus Limnocylindrales bacterium]
MNDTVIEQARKLTGVQGAALVRPPGTVAASNIESKQLNTFFELLYRTAYELDRKAGLGNVSAVVVKTDKAGDLSLLIHDQKALALVSEGSRPLSELSAEVRDLLR